MNLAEFESDDGIFGMRDAWEACIARGAIPTSVLDDADGGRRAFWCKGCEGPRVPGTPPHACAFCDGNGLTHAPTTVRDLGRFLAVDWHRAEELVREAHARLAPWGVPAPERFVWGAEERRDPVDRRVTPAGWLSEVTALADTEAWSERYRTLPHPYRASDEAWWETHVALWRDPRPCPYAPMLDLLQIDVRCFAIGRVVLLAPLPASVRRAP